jgi:hypothetical protein
MTPEPAFAGHAALRGIWGGNPTTVPAGFAQNAVNRLFREDFNRTRPLFQNITLTFESEAQRIWFAAANGQGATFYNSFPSYLSPRLVVSLGGRIFTIEINGTTGVVKQLIDGNSRQFMHAWFAQGFQWLVVQDGIHAPVLWDGTNAARRSNIAKNEVPIGSVMEFIHGRFVLATADGKNSIRISEIAFANTNANPNDILQFPPVLPTYQTAAFLGSITGLKAMPFLDTGDGQNELVALCQFGFTSFNFSGDEASLLGQIQKISLIGSGSQSSHGFASLNGDLFYRAQDGISSYRNARIEYAQRWNQTPVSREVNYWLKPDLTRLLEFIPMVSFQNMVLTGCSPMTSAPNNPELGYHRYCRGMVVLDADSMSTAGRDGTPIWHGMWSGIRPWAFAKGLIGNGERCFAFSFDRDGRNRLYEVTLRQGDDQFETQPRKIQSFYITGEFGSVEARTSDFAPKKFSGGVIEFSELIGQTNFQVDYRPDGSPCWIKVTEGTPGCECPTRADCAPLTAAPQWGRAYLNQVNPNACIPGSSQPGYEFHHCQVRVGMLGPFTVNRLNIRMDLQPDGQIVKCIPPDCRPIDCCPAADDYSYNVAPLGTNTEVPVVPSDVVTYVSTRIFRAVCPGDPLITSIGTGQGTSLVSQADADQKAQAAAQANALAQLHCPQCTPVILFDQIVSSGDSVDLSAYFVSGAQTGNEGLPWRLIDGFSHMLSASGIINDSGTLQVYQVFPPSGYGGGTFDPVTKIYTDSGTGSARLLLERGCLDGGQPVWPDEHSYGV